MARDKWMTHVILLGQAFMWKVASSGDGNVIAEVKYRFDNADIALAKLQPGMSYSNVLFFKDEVSSIKLKGLIHPDKLKVNKTCILILP